jgi:uncharacterized repeat protein (TIGR01451 family)
MLISPRSARCCWPLLAIPLLLGLAERDAKGQNYIYVTYTSQKVLGTGTGGCSLQEAIYAANLHSNKAITGTNPDGTDIFVTTDCVPGTGTDTIVLPYSTTIVMSQALGDAHSALGATGTPLIFSNITIEANGSLLTPSTGARPFRAFAVGGGGSLTIRNAYIKGFVEKGGDGTCGGGGGMGAGGAIYVTAGQLTIENSTFDANGAIGGLGGNPVGTCLGGGGGGLSGNGGTAGNLLFGGGGGSFGDGGNGSGGGGGGGGGTYSNGNDGSNGMGGQGGILCGGNGGSLSSPNGSNTTCPGGGGGGGFGQSTGGSGNYGGGGGGGALGNMQAPANGGGNGGFGGGGGWAAGAGGLGGGGGGANFFNPNAFSGTGGLFAGNGAHTGAGGGGAALGGAIFNEGGSVTVRNSTFATNFVLRGAGAAGNNGADAGGAIFSLNGSLTVLNATISGNQSTGSAGGIEVFATSTASFTLRNTIIANNGARECVADGTGLVQESPGAGNLIGSNFQCPAAVSSADPQLGQLQNNLGSTPTMAIPRTSPAFNAADPASSLPSDQRGQVRPAQGMGGVPDIGAFELCLTGARIAPMPCIISSGNGGNSVPLTIQVSPLAGGNTSPSPGSSNQAPNSVVLLSATPNPGYAFANWTGGVTAPTFPSTAVIMDQAHTVTANFVGIPILNINKTHSGNFTRGQPNATYTVTVSNNGAGGTSGPVNVVDTLPSGLVLASMSGTGWNCLSNTCSRSDALASGASYPSLTVTVDVQFNAASPQVNQVTVSGGGSIPATASDSTMVLLGGVPSLSITETHAGNFAQGQQNATYTIVVSNNNAAAATSGAVTVTDALPSGLTLVSMAGAGWNCSSSACTRSDALAGGASYAPITVTVNVLGNATSPQVNQVSVSGGGSTSAAASDSTVISTGTPTVTVNRTKLNFGYSGALMTSPQAVTVTIKGGAGFNWTATSDHPNVTVSPASGTGSGTFQVTATPPPAGGSSSAIITVTAAGATGSPQQIQVNVISVTPAMPFGSFDTPANNTTGVAGAIAVTGWALDNIEVTSVKVYREPAPGEGSALTFIGDAVFVADARPDVAGTFATAPYQYRGGWGYQMLTNFLPNASGSGPLGNGTYNLHVLATNANGTVTDLGTRTITVDNIHASKPFGTIDTPAQGGTATGNAYFNFGWALTQNPFAIPTDGSTIFVYLDGVVVGHPVYNQFRSDIASLFPGYANSNGAVGFFLIDTTKLQNKIHTISWSVTDNGGRVDGIGSRYFTVFNSGGGGVAAPEDPPTPESLAGTVQLRRGYDLNAPASVIAPDDTGSYAVEMEQSGRIELSLGATNGYQIVGDQPADLPLGSSLKAGVFYWEAPIVFLGTYEMVFERPDGPQIRVRINIVPKRYSPQ